MPSQHFPVVLPIADLADALGATRPERIADALDVAVAQGVAQLSTDADGRPVVALALKVAQRLGLTCEGGVWFTEGLEFDVFQDLSRIAAASRLKDLRREAAPIELVPVADERAEPTVRARRPQPKPKRRKTPAPTKSRATAARAFNLAALRAQLDGSGGG